MSYIYLKIDSCESKILSHLEIETFFCDNIFLYIENVLEMLELLETYVDVIRKM